VDSEEDAEMKKKKRESQRPNYFVSIPITDTQVSCAVHLTAVQGSLCTSCPVHHINADTSLHLPVIFLRNYILI